MQNTTPPLATGYNGVSNFGIEGYVWSSPGSYRIPLHRYYLSNGNNHHVVTSDAAVIAFADALLAAQLADPSAVVTLVDEGILGYVETQPQAGNQKLYSLKYGDENIFSISTSLAGYAISTDPNQAFQHGVWYATVFQDLLHAHRAAGRHAGAVPGLQQHGQRQPVLGRQLLQHLGR